MKLLLKSLHHPQHLSKSPELKYWLFILSLTLLLYSTFSTNDFSFLLTLSSLLSSLSFLGIFLQVQFSDNGLSKTTFILYTLVYSFRLCSIIPYSSYLPNDSSDWIYKLTEFLSFVQSAILAYRVKIRKENPVLFLIVLIAVVLAIVVHPSLNKNFLTDSCWMASMMLETFAVVPLMWRVLEMKDFENFSSHFIAAHSISRILSFVFWADSYEELNRTRKRAATFSYVAGYFVVGSQVGTLMFTGNFLWEYVKSAVLGTPLVLPL